LARFFVCGYVFYALRLLSKHFEYNFTRPLILITRLVIMVVHVIFEHVTVLILKKVT
jgi:hypothetical protein